MTLILSPHFLFPTCFLAPCVPNYRWAQFQRTTSHHHPHNQQKLLRMAKKKFNLLNAIKTAPQNNSLSWAYTFCIIQLKYSKLIIQMLTKRNLASVYHCYLLEKLPDLFKLPWPEASLDYFNSLYLVFLLPALAPNSLFYTQKSESSLWNINHVSHHQMKSLKSFPFYSKYKPSLQVLHEVAPGHLSNLISYQSNLNSLAVLPTQPAGSSLGACSSLGLNTPPSDWLSLSSSETGCRTGSLSSSLCSNSVLIDRTSWSWSLYLK